MHQVATLRNLRCPHCGSDQISVTGVKGSLGASVAIGLTFGAIGNIVAGKKAAANTATEPLQYKCASCKQKFESMPLIAPEEDMLSAPCTVSFTRQKSFVGAAVVQMLYLNGVKLGAVKNGETVSFITENRYNILFLTDQYGVAFKGDCRFEAQPGGSISVAFSRKLLSAEFTADVSQNPGAVPVTGSYSVHGSSAATESGTYAAQTFGTAPTSRTLSSALPGSQETPPVRFCVRCGTELEEHHLFCPVCGTQRFDPKSMIFTGSAFNDPAEKAPAALQTCQPQRAVALYGLVSLLWLAMLILQSAMNTGLRYSTEIFAMCTAALTGLCVYLFLQEGLKHKITAAIGGLITVLLSACGAIIILQYTKMDFDLRSILHKCRFGIYTFNQSFFSSLLYTAGAMGLACLVWTLCKQKTAEKRLQLTALTAAAIKCGIPCLLYLYNAVIHMSLMGYSVIVSNVISAIVGYVLHFLILYKTVGFADQVCRRGNSRITITEKGKLIAIVAIILGAAVSGLVLFWGPGSHRIVFCSWILLGIMEAIGFLLLLLGRPSGMSIAVMSAHFILSAQLQAELTALVNSYTRLIPQMIVTLIFLLCPYMASRILAAAEAAPIAAQPIQQPAQTPAGKVKRGILWYLLLILLILTSGFIAVGMLFDGNDMLLLGIPAAIMFLAGIFRIITIKYDGYAMIGVELLLFILFCFIEDLVEIIPIIIFIIVPLLLHLLVAKKLKRV